MGRRPAWQLRRCTWKIICCIHHFTPDSRSIRSHDFIVPPKTINRNENLCCSFSLFHYTILRFRFVFFFLQDSPKRMMSLFDCMLLNYPVRFPTDVYSNYWNFLFFFLRPFYFSVSINGNIHWGNFWKWSWQE